MSKHFGRPSLGTAGSGAARWIRGNESPYDQKSPTGWLAELYGGAQSGDDYARINIPVDELYPFEFKSGLWTWYQTNAEEYGVNLVIWMHDPTDNDKRCEVTQAPSGATLEKTSGWNAHELDITATQFFYYGEGTVGSGLTEGTQYKWTQFQSDTIFSKWTIYRVTLEWGWYSTGTFENAYVADVKFNNEIVPLEPTIAEILSSPEAGGRTTLKTVSTTKVIVAGGANSAGDVISNESTNGSGTAWTFSAIANKNGGSGYIVKAHVICETTALTGLLSLYLFTATPTSELDDNAANTALFHADQANYVGRIDFPALSENGTGDSETVATPSTYGNLPLAFTCAAGVDDLFGILVSVTATTITAGDDVIIKLTAENL